MSYSNGKVCISDLFGQGDMYLSLKYSKSENLYLPLSLDINTKPLLVDNKSILVNPTDKELDTIARQYSYLVATHNFLIEYVVGKNLSYVFDDENETEQRDIPFISLYEEVKEFLSAEAEDNRTQDLVLGEMQMLLLCDFPCIDLLVTYPFRIDRKYHI